jgi:hypothetical protein
MKESPEGGPMPIRVLRTFPKRPLTPEDFPGGRLNVNLTPESMPGWVPFSDEPGAPDCSASIHLAYDGEEIVGCMFVQSDHRLLFVCVRPGGGSQEALEALARHAVMEAGERPLVGYAPDDVATRATLRSVGLKVMDGERGLCLFFTRIPRFLKGRKG